MREFILRAFTDDEAETCIRCGLQEVVRCKDCSFAFFKEGLVLDGHIFCTKPGTERGNAVKPNDWYCGDGKRSETDGH